jgi:ABC-2 type transport system ATP-binding protein
VIVGVERVAVRFGEVQALSDVTLSAHPGEVTAVVGGDGAGKTTLLRLLANRVRADAGEVRTLNRARLGYQHATSGVWPMMTVDENVAFVGRSYGMSEPAMRSRSSLLLERAGLGDARRKLGNQLSGGMRQKLGFVLAILHEPDLVLLDEPSTGVDPVSRLELWRLISATAREGTTVVMSTTYLDEAQRAVSVLALQGGRMLASGTPGDIVAAVPGSVGVLAPSAPPAAAMAGRAWRRGTERHVWIPPGVDADGAAVLDPPDFEDALIALSLAAGDVETAPAAPAPGTRAAWRATHSENSRGGRHEVASAGESRRGGGATATARDVVKRYGHLTAVDDVSLDVHPGEIVGLIGANGAGKTTLLRIMLGLERGDEGEVSLFGQTPNSGSRGRLGYMPQGLGLYTTLSVKENAAFLSRVYGVPEPQLPPALREVRSSIVSDIGLGRQRQLAFALALSHGPELLVLDEPTSGVDPIGRARLWDAIHAQADAGRAVIVTTHYLQEAEQCSRLVLLANGRVAARGSVSDLVGAATAVLVRSADWQAAFAVLDRSDLPIMLSGRDIRVAGSEDAASLRRRVDEALRGIPAEVQPVPATLEETVVLLDSDSRAPAVL